MAKFQLDEIDQKILTCLAKNARTPFLEIARDCGVSGAAIHQRFKKMESLGIITGSRLLVKPSALDLNVCAFVSVNLSPISNYEDVVESLKKIPEVVECHFITGRHSILIKVFCFNHDHLLDIIINSIHTIPSVQDTETMVSLDQPIERGIWVKDKKENKGFYRAKAGKGSKGARKPKKA